MAKSKSRQPKRQKLPAKASKKIFTKTASKTRPENLRAAPMRGGIRM